MTTHRIRVTVNGTAHEAEIEPRILLVHFLRDVLRLTGTHIGCDTTHCGACTVLLDGKPIKSCTLFAVQADGRDILTVEGLEQDGQLHPIQEGFWQEHGLQCGFCTPGMLMTGYALLQHNPAPQKMKSAGPSLAICAAARGMSTLSKRSSMQRRKHGRERHHDTPEPHPKSAVWDTPSNVRKTLDLSGDRAHMWMISNCRACSI